MVIVEVYLSLKHTTFLDPDKFSLQLATGQIPFSDLASCNVADVVLRGERPQMPHHFDAPGITPEVWMSAEKCWHRRAEERPEIEAVLQDLQKVAKQGEYTFGQYSYWGNVINL